MVNKELLIKMVNEKLVYVNKHPSADLFIYNYSPEVQYNKSWNEITLQTRGLILDSNMNYVARPFPKFFNLSEHVIDEIPNESFDVFDKVDGSLGILYWLNDKPFISTRGSFISEQAIHGTKILYDKYLNIFDKLNKNYTYLFEIIYPSNRIVINYDGLDDLILLCVIDNNTGLDLPIPDIGFPIVKKYDGITDINILKTLESNNKEGFVVLFKNGFRVKCKFDEYCRLHKIITMVSEVTIWENLSSGTPMLGLLEKVPDEFYSWLEKTQNELIESFNKILDENKLIFKEFETRKETALYFLKQKNPSVLFNMLDGKSPDKVIWNLIKPKRLI